MIVVARGVAIVCARAKRAKHLRRRADRRAVCCGSAPSFHTCSREQQRIRCAAFVVQLCFRVSALLGASGVAAVLGCCRREVAVLWRSWRRPVLVVRVVKGKQFGIGRLQESVELGILSGTQAGQKLHART